MAAFVRRFFLYVLNISAISYMVFILLFSTNSVVAIYKNLSEINYKLEKEYDGILDKYKNLMVFILKNRLPQNINYFNLAGEVSYKLPPIKYFLAGESKNIIVSWDNKIPNDDSVVIGCYKNKCIKIFVDKKVILNLFLNNKLWGFREITIPIKKMMLLKVAINSFLETHKKNLLCFFVMYLFQSLFLFRRLFKLTQIYTFLLDSSDKNEQTLIKQTSEYNKLSNSLLFIQELTGEYFTHYIHQLLTRNLYIKELDVVNVLLNVEKFLVYQITKNNLRFVLDYDQRVKIVKSDYEAIFIILLNLIFKAIFRSKISSEVVVKILQIQNSIDIKIIYIGYEYNPKLNDDIRIYALPDLVLKKLCQKVKVDIEETRKDEVNVISVKVINIELEEVKEIRELVDNVIRIGLPCNVKKN